MDIFERISDIIRQQLCLDEDFEIRESTSISELGADSLDVVEIVMAVEDEFGIEIPDGDEEKLHTVGEVAVLVAELM